MAIRQRQPEACQHRSRPTLRHLYRPFFRPFCVLGSAVPVVAAEEDWASSNGVVAQERNCLQRSGAFLVASRLGEGSPWCCGLSEANAPKP